MKNGLASSREKLCECSRPTPRRAIAEKMGSRVLGRKPGNQKAMAAAEVSRLGLALHFAHRTYSNRFARIRTTKSQRERGEERENPGFTLVMRAPEGKKGQG